jgi:hypothetical protein
MPPASPSPCSIANRPIITRADVPIWRDVRSVLDVVRARHSVLPDIVISGRWADGWHLPACSR